MDDPPGRTTGRRDKRTKEAPTPRGVWSAATLVRGRRKGQSGAMQEPVPATLLERTRSMLRRTWRDVVGAARVKLTGSVRPDLPQEDLQRLRQQIDACLDSRGGEVSARARAADLGRVYLGLEDKGKSRFLAMLARDYGVDRELLREAMAVVQNAASAEDQLAAERDLRTVLVPPRVKLLRHFNGLKQGVKFLVDMRADLLRFAGTDPALQGLERDLRDLLAGWFDIGFLELRRITWQAPAALLEKLVAYEAVHEIRSWTDLKNRLESDRRCYAFFHPSMPDEPLIFVEVALVDGMAGNVQTLLDESAPDQDPEAANTAIFYSISNTQKGLAGVSFGSFLIKHVVDDLVHDLPNLKTFATLSPIPGFRGWLADRLAGGDAVITKAEEKALAGVAGVPKTATALLDVLERPDWAEDAELAGTLEPIMMRLCARYLVGEVSNGKAPDPVAHFHLSNGARVERINWLADRSPRGLSQSAGLMVNYLYKLADIETNHEDYTGDGTIAASATVRALQ